MKVVAILLGLISLSAEATIIRMNADEVQMKQEGRLSPYNNSGFYTISIVYQGEGVYSSGYYGSGSYIDPDYYGEATFIKKQITFAQEKKLKLVIDTNLGYHNKKMRKWLTFSEY